MATSFPAAALGAEGLAADVTMLIGNGYVPGHAELALRPGPRRTRASAPCSRPASPPPTTPLPPPVAVPPILTLCRCVTACRRT